MEGVAPAMEPFRLKVPKRLGALLERVGDSLSEGVPGEAGVDTVPLGECFELLDDFEPELAGADAGRLNVGSETKGAKRGGSEVPRFGVDEFREVRGESFLLELIPHNFFPIRLIVQIILIIFDEFFFNQ